MATSATSKKSASTKPLVKNGLTLVWLDDSPGQDPDAKTLFLTLFEQVFIFADAAKCLELVESAQDQPSCISILINGSLGEKLVHDRLQPLPQVKDIYVFCYNVPKHKQWAAQCDKVRCVEADFKKILHHLQHDVLKGSKHATTHSSSTAAEGEGEVEEIEIEHVEREPQRFTADNNLYDQLALNLLLEQPDHDDGIDDFKKYCQTSTKEGDNDYKAFKPDEPIRNWYKDNLVFLQLNSTDLGQIWALRWFIHHLYGQIKEEYDQLIKKETEITVNYGTWFSEDELNRIKHLLGESVISTGLLHTYKNEKDALQSMGKKPNQEKSHRVLLKIDVDTSIHPTVPYGEIHNREILFFFGSRFQLLKIELIKPREDNQEPYWLIGAILSSTFDVNPSAETLYQYYRKTLIEYNNLHYAFGRILMYKGLYIQAANWFQPGDHPQELAELAIRRNQIERANQYLSQASEDSDHANLLRAYVYLLTGDENTSKARTLLMKISSETTDRIVRARINITLGFINLIVSQQADQALEYFQTGNETLRKILPAIHPDIAKSWIGVGYAYLTEHNKDEAQKAFEEALKIQQQSLPSTHPDLAKTYNGLAHCFARDKQTIKQALKELESAFEILVRAYPQEYKTHPEFISTQHDYQKIRKGKELHARNTLLDYI